MDSLPYQTDASWTTMIESSGMNEFWSDAISTDDSYTGSSSVCETPRSPSSCDGTEAVEMVPTSSMPFSLPISESVTPVPVHPIDFQMSVGCGLIEPVEKVLAAPKIEINLKKLSTRVFVRRREMSPSNPLFHSIRTRTASVVSVCFFGEEQQVNAIAQRVPRIFFNVESFLNSAESLKSNEHELLLLIKMRDVNECAHFAFSHGALAVPPVLMYASPATSSDSQPMYGCVMEFVLAAIDTTIRNLGGQRTVNVDLDVLLNSGPIGGLQASYAEFPVQVDVQLGLAGRSARPRRGDSKKARGRKTSAAATKVPKVVAPRVYKRGPMEPEYNLERKVQTRRPLDLESLVPVTSALPALVSAPAAPVTSETVVEYEAVHYAPAPTFYLPQTQSYCAQTLSAGSFDAMIPSGFSAASMQAYASAPASYNAPHASNMAFASFYGSTGPVSQNQFGYLPQMMDDSTWLYPTPQVAAYGATSHSFYTPSAISASCDQYRYGTSL